MKKQHKKGIIAILLAFLLCAVFLRPAYAEDIEGDFPYETSGLSGKPEANSFSYVYRDSFFETSSYEMNPDLARLAMRLAIAGFGVGESSEPNTLLSMFDTLGIRYSEETVHYEVPGPDTIGYAYGMREISDDEVLIVTVVRGGNYQKEWASNFTLGYSEDHEGFRACADIIVKDLGEYIGTIPAGKKVSLLLTGYSRAAAVSNLAAAVLDQMADESRLGSVTPGNIYAYCFACPLTTRRTEEASKALYSNIFCFLHPADPVPKVAPGEWGYGRFGKSYLLPTAIHTDGYDAYRETFVSLFCRYSLAEYYPIQAINILKMDRAISATASTLIAPSIYVLTVQDSIRKAILGDGEEDSFLSSLFGDIGDSGIQGADVIYLNNPFVAHAPELYLAALDAIGDGAILQNTRTEYDYFTCEGDVTAHIYDHSGNTVLKGNGQVVLKENGEALLHDEEGFGLCGADYDLGTLLFDCVSTETYYAVLEAVKDTKIDLRCGQFNSLASRDAKRYDYNKVVLKEGECAVLVLDPKEPLLYRTTSDSAETMLAALIQGKATDVEPVKPKKITVSEQDPTDDPELNPTPEATPTVTPTVVPTAEPTVSPDVTPTAEPDVTPEATPASEPTVTPAVTPADPTGTPAENPTLTPSGTPEGPTEAPTVTPAETPEGSDNPEEATEFDDGIERARGRGKSTNWLVPAVAAAVGVATIAIAAVLIRRKHRKKDK